MRDLSSAAMAALSDVEGVEDDVERSMGDSRRLELIAPPLSAADPDPVPDPAAPRSRVNLHGIPLQAQSTSSSQASSFDMRGRNAVHA